MQIAVVESWSWPTCSWNILSLLVLRVCELGVASSAVSSKHGGQFLFHGTPLVIVTRGRQAAVDPVEIACLLSDIWRSLPGNWMIDLVVRLRPVGAGSILGDPGCGKGIAPVA
ncbi:hypothetical protein ACFVDQ_32415 [Streptomyces sp. NPDC057684]|uniref:hypothetical protein n=1 Tax=unclassified Streptomyces TaxID=2593676 RepID=UPI00367A3D53